MDMASWHLLTFRDNSKKLVKLFISSNDQHVVNALATERDSLDGALF